MGIEVEIRDWEAASTLPGEATDALALDALEWRPVSPPLGGTGAPPGVDDPDACDWWFRARFDAEPGAATLRLEGVATVWEAHLNGTRILEGESMFVAGAAEVSLEARNDLAIRCLALGPLLAERRRPRARWRTRLVADGNLRWWRTSLVGRAPGLSPVAPIVGPWRPVRIEPAGMPTAGGLRILAGLDGEDGVVDASIAAGRRLDDAELALSGPSGEHRAPMRPTATGAEGRLRVPAPARWWPHTHGPVALHDVSLLAAGEVLAHRRIGFRELAPGPGSTRDVLDAGLDLHVNGVRVFARGALWTPVPAGELRATLERARDAGMNMVRIPGTMAYESDEFHDLCDELGILVWQDFMFANLDYPIADGRFRALVELEAAQLTARLAHRPSTAVWCGNSEIEQQVAMLGLDPGVGRGELFGELLPAAVEASGSDATYVPSAPVGGDMPFRPDRGVAHYFGVGGYRRPLEDARRAGVRFAAECLALANVPAADPGSRTEGVPRDIGADWDFADVRDHYLELLYGIPAAELAAGEPERYLELSRAVSGEVMAEVFGEWRRPGSPCRGGLVLWLRDLVAGSGWGVLDSGGAPKPVWHHLRRALAPVAVWTIDEGLGGIAVHVANDGREVVRARLRVALYRDLEVVVAEAAEELELAPGGHHERDVEGLLGRFVDVSWAYRFGPPQQDVVVASLERDAGGGTELLGQAFRFPVGRPAERRRADELGLEARLLAGAPGVRARLLLRSRKVVHGLRIRSAGLVASDDALSLEPGHERVLSLEPSGARDAARAVTITAVNLAGRVEVAAA